MRGISLRSQNELNDDVSASEEGEDDEDDDGDEGEPEDGLAPFGKYNVPTQ